MSGVLRILTAAVRKEENSKSCKGDILKNAAGRGKNGGKRESNLPVSSQGNGFFSFHLLLEKVFFEGGGRGLTFRLFRGWEGK